MANENDNPENAFDAPSVPEITVSEPRKRGRPPGKKNSAPTQTQSTSPKNSPQTDRTEEATIIGNCGVMLWQLAENLLHNQLQKKLRGQTQLENAFTEVSTKAALTKPEADMVRDALTKIAARYDITTKHAPEVALIMVAASYGVRQMQLVKFVKEISPPDDEKRTEQKS
jgi:hypothetical protein